MNARSNKNQDSQGFPFGFRKKPVDEQLQRENWDAVQAAISKLQETASRPETAPVRRIAWSRALMAAAAVCLVVVGIWYVSTRTGHPQFAELRTGYGEVKNILLPDSSVVILNANSSIRIPQQWKDEEGRQVWLEGEAYFQVQKNVATKQKFVVHTRQVDVEVLGTKFNVNTRREHSIVSLEEGKVRLSVHGESTMIQEKKAQVVIRPGQVMTIDGSSQPRVNTEKDVAIHSGWSRNEFHFDNTSLAEVARLIEDVYGYRMEATDTILFKRSVSGDLRAANLQELVKVLEVTLKLSMWIENRTIYVSNRVP